MFQAAYDYFKENKVNVVINDSPVEFTPNAVAWNNTTLVPFRKLFESYGADVEYDPKSKTVTAKKYDITIKIYIDSRDAEVNGTKVTVKQGSLVLKDTVYVQLRFISESLGAKVNFNKETMTVYINLDK
ncbi:copper amine oxidase N-terminal domain-containing protein [Paenibacillus gansuensis]|uniref:Copper amine oxidase N-terminal domain-containing protein n=1 Tax=Paenibacillus gansuensis TaxID=306542 RepID=A0ABW5PFU2_9BACL